MKIFWVVIILMYSITQSLAGVINYHDPNQNIVIGKNIDILEDPTNKLNIDQVKSSPHFRRSTDEVPNFGISYSTFWARFSIQNRSELNHLLLNIPLPFLNLVELYELSDNGMLIHTQGEKKPFSHRVYDVTDFLFDIYINKNETKTFYIKIHNTDMLQLPIILGGYHSMLSFSFHKEYILGISFGIFFIVFFYNLFIYFSIRDNSYLYYVAYIYMLFLDHAILYGYGEKYLMLDSEWMSNHFSLFGSLTGISGILFAMHFLKTNLYLPKSNILMFGMLGLFVLSILLSLFNFYIESFYFTVIGCIFFTIGIFAVCSILLIQKHKTVKYFFIGSSLFLVCLTFFILSELMIIPLTIYTVYFKSLGFALEAIALSFALANKINVLTKENAQKQEEIINQLKQNEEYLEAWKKVQLDSEKLKRESLLFQYEALKNQVNPHFLFNSLNVLGELVYQSPSKSYKFIEELSNVYRYVLDNKDKEVVTLKEELEFINAFLYLLKIRFSNNLVISIEVFDIEDKMVAPLTFQLLVENAIKHNIASLSEPLHLRIFTENESIVISNTYQPKRSPQKSSGIGLKNIIERYKYLSERTILITNDYKTFEVKVPLLYFKTKAQKTSA